ncbi:MAG: UDP-N-acetylglucosamine 1-carboxyvinyltransferase, partial [Actinomycetes bacterium]
MERFRVAGGARLSGKVTVAGAKNSALKLMASALLAPGETIITNLPAIADVDYMAELLTRLGCKVKIDKVKGEVSIDVPEKLGHRADYDLVRKMRASINVLGPLITRVGEADVALPGGDAIGSRGLDYHINGLTDMGAAITLEHGFIIAKAPNGLKGANITLEFPSVGATENIMTAATLASGITTIDNAAREPDVVDLGEFLIAMGAKISGLGSHTITIEGVKQLIPTKHATLADRIVTGTWAFAAAITQGDITIENGRADHLEVPLDKLVEAGAVITTTENGFRVKMDKRPVAVDVATLPYPGFPTDLQPMVIALNAIADGTSLVT